MQVKSRSEPINGFVEIGIPHTIQRLAKGRGQLSERSLRQAVSATRLYTEFCDHEPQRRTHFLVRDICDHVGIALPLRSLDSSSELQASWSASSTGTPRNAFS